ncbi:MAG TPA: VOC family protein, partial [Actinoplanes sp.]|nr:VOC family protein [Actinoplanes sp.]
LELSVENLDAGETAILAIGATKPEHQPQPDRWRVLLDPAGHPFCISAMS